MKEELKLGEKTFGLFTGQTCQSTAISEVGFVEVPSLFTGPSFQSGFVNTTLAYLPSLYLGAYVQRLGATQVRRITAG
jgi:hypothetical protein